MLFTVPKEPSIFHPILCLICSTRGDLILFFHCWYNLINYFFSFWESTDVISFILRQVTLSDNQVLSNSNDAHNNLTKPAIGRIDTDSHDIVSRVYTEKWIKKRTSMKVRNGAANHRGNDVIVLEGKDQVLHGRFSYGSFDMAVLSGEKVATFSFKIFLKILLQVDIHIMKEPPNGQWSLLDTQLTDKAGRVSFKVNLIKHL